MSDFADKYPGVLEMFDLAERFSGHRPACSSVIIRGLVHLMEESGLSSEMIEDTFCRANEALIVRRAEELCHDGVE